ncbi:hypothetical protein PoB_003048800 [Plakobranchus ocellatus]|uniref:Uncharacterized protein n=1 Tax=Plakobranchus ocellatus TaxID=259542 RepID=A0AAV4A9S5_9GAST|nr:hypothetical protein PoB_003048800 [Plakobranchus ocellatus]
MRREKLENLVTTGMLEGKRSRGKQREKLIEGLADWLKAGKSLEAIEATKDKKKWRTMIANAVKQGTDDDDDSRPRLLLFWPLFTLTFLVRSVGMGGFGHFGGPMDREPTLRSVGTLLLQVWFRFATSARA